MKNVLSLFNGMGCIWIALDRTGIQVNKRYSSEIEKYPNKANDLLYPDTIQLGDVRNVDVSKLEPIYLLAGGSPCQSFSFAGKRKGMATKCEIEILSLEYYLELKEQNFEFEGQSYLFWEYIRILTDIRKYNPDVKFLLENVIMGSKWQKVITRAIGINPININSSLVSAQNRNRLYWTNIYTEQDGLFGDLKCMIPQPKDKGILLKDILESDVLDKYFLSEKALKFVISEERLKKKYTQNANENEKYLPHLARNKTNWCGDFVVHNTMPRSSKTGKVETGPLSRNDGKTYCLDTGNTNAIEIQCVAMRGRNPDNPKSRIAGLPTEQQLEPRKDGKTNCLTSVQKDNLIFTKNYVQWDISGKGYKSQQDRAHYDDGKSGCIPSSRTENKTNVLIKNKTIRRLTPRECGRLQTVPEEKLEILINSEISDTQLYKMFGNGWTIDVIAYILSFINKINN